MLCCRQSATKTDFDEKIVWESHFLENISDFDSKLVYRCYLRGNTEQRYFEFRATVTSVSCTVSLLFVSYLHDI
ncbi:hypothetical protein LINPERHAP1_LOCUS36383 [Linum perenne]